VTEGDPEAARLRGVERFWRFTDRAAVVRAVHLSAARFESAAHGDQRLRHGAGGMGHVAITSRDPESFLEFWQSIFDARVSDRIEDRLDGIGFDFTFLRLNERHHSSRLPATRALRMDPIRTPFMHLNLPGRHARRRDRSVPALPRARAPHREHDRPAPQRPRAVVLRREPVGFEIELAGTRSSCRTSRPGRSPGTAGSACGGTSP